MRPDDLRLYNKYREMSEDLYDFEGPGGTPRADLKALVRYLTNKSPPDDTKETLLRMFAEYLNKSNEV